MWFKYVLLISLALSPIMSIATIGDEREPISRSDAVISLIVNALIIAGLLYYWR